MGRPVSGDLPIGFAGRGTAGRLSGGGTTTFGALRVGLGLGDGFRVADSVGDGDARSVPSVAAGDGETGVAGEVPVTVVVGEGDDGRSDGVAVGVGLAGLMDVAGGVDEAGAPDGVTVQAVMRPAHTRALRANVGPLTGSG